MSNSETVLITGGAGFIGRAVVARSLAQGWRPIVYDNFAVGRRENLREFGDRAHVVEADILDGASLRRVLREFRPTRVFHLAAHHFIPFCNAHPQETMRVNVEGTFALLDAAAAEGSVQTAVIASSGVIYPSREGLLHEDDAPLAIDVYGLSKLMCEHLADYFAKTTPVRCIAARLFNTYGPYETNPHLLPHIMECLHRGSVVPLGNMHTKRDYIYVEDVADMLVRLSGVTDARRATCNVGTGQEYSARQIMDMLSELLGRPIQVEVASDRVRASDKLHQRADTARLKAMAGALPRYSLKEGLRQLLRHEGLLK